MKLSEAFAQQKRPFICISLMGTNLQELAEEIASLQGKQVDVIEWRVDCFDTQNKQKMVDTLHWLSKQLTQYFFLFTFRGAKEGGKSELGDAEYVDLYQMGMESGCIDVIDIEITRGDAVCQTLQKIAKDNEIEVLLSYHDMHGYDESKNQEMLIRMQEYAGDIFKIACMPKTFYDVLALMQFHIEQKKKIHVPMLTIAMGELGSVTRIWGGFYDSCMTFASNRQKSAPGQLSLSQMQMFFEVLYGKEKQR